MNTLLKTVTPALIALVAGAALSGSAFAGESVHGFAHESTGTPKTRAEVVAELQQFRQSGQTHLWTDGYPLEPVLNATPRTRAEVIAELREAQVSGEYAQLHANEPALVQVHPRPAATTTVGSAALNR